MIRVLRKVSVKQTRKRILETRANQHDLSNIMTSTKGQANFPFSIFHLQLSMMREVVAAWNSDPLFEPQEWAVKVKMVKLEHEHGPTSPRDGLCILLHGPDLRAGGRAIQMPLAFAFQVLNDKRE